MAKYELPPKFDRSTQHLKAARAQISGKYHLNVMTEGQPSCKKGCHTCCYYPVFVGLMEALIIYRDLSKRRMWTSQLKRKFEEASERTKGLNVEVWILSKISCPLLNEEKGTCSAYEIRPFSCRTVFSLRDPYYCDPSHSGGLPPVVPRKEVLDEFGQLETDLLKKHDLGRIVLPLPSAVLIAEKLDKGEVNFAMSGAYIWKDFIQRW